LLRIFCLCHLRIGAGAAFWLHDVGMRERDSTKPSLGKGMLDSVLGYHIAQARVTVQGMFLRHIGHPFNLRPVEYSLLMLLQANASLTPKQLSRTLALSSPNLTTLLDRMQERGLLERLRSQVDRRSQQIVLTSAGIALTNDLSTRTPSMESGLAKVLSPAERAMLMELLGKVAAYSVETADADLGECE
jgi:DNA-binding MarR family transcriptional regulator